MRFYYCSFLTALSKKIENYSLFRMGHPPREGKALASASESDCSLQAVRAGGGRGRGNRESGNHVWRRNVLLKPLSWKKTVEFWNPASHTWNFFMHAAIISCNDPRLSQRIRSRWKERISDLRDTNRIILCKNTFYFLLFIFEGWCKCIFKWYWAKNVE